MGMFLKLYLKNVFILHFYSLMALIAGPGIELVFLIL